MERFVLDGDHIALVFDGQGNLEERFLHGTEIDQVIAQESGDGAVNWALTDNQGSVRLVLDSQGNVVNQITYDAYGNVTLESNDSVEFRFGYTGRELDDETGLNYYGARYRDAGIGSFISEDPIGFSAGDFNLYRYTFNSPINFTDPSGNSALVLVPIAAAALAIGAVGIWYTTQQLQELLKDPGTVIDPPYPYIPPTGDNTFEDEEQKVPTPPPEPKPIPHPSPQIEPYTPDPNKDECEDECEKYRDFAHGSSLESVNNIVANGISNEAIGNLTRGGRVNRRGFYTIELTEPDGNSVPAKLSLAYRFGQLAYRSDPNSPSAVLIMQLCDDVYRELEAINQVLKRPIAGEERFTETIFKPGSFSTLNREARFIDVLIP